MTALGRLVHGSAVAFELPERVAGVLITGKSGTGKSELALELMAMGARLVSDDQTCLCVDGGIVQMSPPSTIRGLIEMRGIGLMRAKVLEPAPLAVLVDLDMTETERLPPVRNCDVQGVAIPLLRKCASRAFAAGIRQYVMSRDWADPKGKIP